MSTEEQIFSLIVAAQEQQKTTERTLADLTAILEEVKTYDYRMRFLNDSVSSMQGSVSKVRETFDKSLNDFKKVVKDTVEVSVEGASKDASNRAADGLINSFKPILDSINKVSQRAENSVAAFEESSRQLSLRRILFMGCCAASMVFLGFGIIAWQRYDYEILKKENAELLQSNQQLRGKGAAIRFNTCENRVCIEVGSDIPKFYYSENDSRVWVVPKGY